jgi:hypothetical protein
MANGIPVRLSADLAQRARSAAETADRSVTDQVEHWARLGQAVEDVVLAKTVERLKARSHDADLDARLAFAATPAGRDKAVALIAARNPVRHGVDDSGALEVVAQRSTRTATRRAATKRAAPRSTAPGSAAPRSTAAKRAGATKKRAR